MLRFLLSLVIPVALAQSGPTVVVNETFYDAVGSDTGNEWVELKNTGSEVVDISGWKIQSAGKSFGSSVPLPAGTIINPGGYLVVGGANVGAANYTTDKLSLQNGGEATDGVRLVNQSGEVIDVVLYDQPNTNGLADGTGSAGTSFAAAALAGNSLARIPDGADTNNNSADFVVTGSLTPGAANEAGAVTTPTPSPTPSPVKLPMVTTGPSPSPKTIAAVTPVLAYSTSVVINQFLPNSTGADTTDEFIELKNIGTATVDLTNWQLDDAEGGSSPYHIPTGVVLAAGAVRSFYAAETKLALNNSSDSVRLISPDGKVQGQFRYDKTVAGASYNRLDNGTYILSGKTGTITATTQPSPRASAGAATNPSPSPTNGLVAGVISRSAPIAVINVAPSTRPSFLRLDPSAGPGQSEPAIISSPENSQTPEPNISPTSTPVPVTASLDRGGLYKVGGLLLAAIAVFGITSYKSWLPFISSF